MTTIRNINSQPPQYNKIIIPFNYYIIIIIILIISLSLLDAEYVHAGQLYPNEKLPKHIVRHRTGETINLLYGLLSDADSSLAGMAVTTVTNIINNNNNNKAEYRISKAFGHGSIPRDGNKQGQWGSYIPSMSMDSGISMNTMYEVLLAAAAVKLQLENKYTDSLDNDILPEYSPGGVALKHPVTGKSLTYRQLLTHTSTLLDTKEFYKYLKRRKYGTMVAVETLAEFIESYFLDSGGVLKKDIFSISMTPGAPLSYHFSTINTALIAYILNKALKALKLPYNGIEYYITEMFIVPFGLQNTFFLTRTGYPPKTVVVPEYSGIYTASEDPTDIRSYGVSGYSGSIIDDVTLYPHIHPAFVSDYMPYTSVSDLAKITEGLFVKPLYIRVSNVMRQLFTIALGTEQVEGQRGRGLGVLFYSPTVVCRAGTETMIIKTCPLNNESQVFGYSSYRDGTQVGFICTEMSSPENAIICVISAFIYINGEERGTRPILAAAATVFQDIVGDVLYTLSSTTSTTDGPYGSREGVEVDPFFGVYVFMAVFSTILFIYFVSRVIVFVFLQGVVVGGAVTGVVGNDNIVSPDKLSPGKMD